MRRAKQFILPIILMIPLLNLAKASESQSQIDTIVDRCARASYASINKNWAYDLTGHPSTTAREWDLKMREHDKQIIPMLRWKPDLQANLSQAIRSILDCITKADCFIAARVVRMNIIADILGDTTMAEFGRETSKLFDPTEFSFISKLSWGFLTECGEDFKGVCFFPFVNILAYKTFKPRGPACNDNVFRLNDGTFIGFDPTFYTQPRSYEELEQQMYELFCNDQHLDPNCVDDHKAFCKSLTFDKFKFLRKLSQKEAKPYRFDPDKVAEFKLSLTKTS